MMKNILVIKHRVPEGHVWKQERIFEREVANLPNVKRGEPLIIHEDKENESEYVVKQAHYAVDKIGNVYLYLTVQ